MSIFRFGSIRTQVQLLAALSAATALVVACAAFVINDMQVLSASKRQQLYRYAAVVSRHVSPELAKGQWEAAKSQLETLRIEPTVTSACLFDAAGRVVAVYRRDAIAGASFPAASDKSWLVEEEGGEISLFQPIHQNQLRVGSLFMRSTSDDIHRQQAAYPLIVGVVFLISLGVAASFASRMQNRISSPIEALARAARRISEEGDYSVRVNQRATGQLGDLCFAFNAMLDHIESADASLQQARDELNARVRDRTRELHREVLERRFAESIISGQKRVLQQLATGKPLPGVLSTLLAEVESHISNTVAAISIVEQGSEWFDEPIGLQLSSPQREGLKQLPFDPKGPAPARVAALGKAQHDFHDAKEEQTAGFDSTIHGGACWAYPVLTSDGRLLGVITLFHRKDREPAEEELELIESACSLASLSIEQRNGEKALKDAMHKATAANRAKSDFLANMSHEIRTPLNAILGFTDLMRSSDDELDAERRDYLDTIASSGKHLLALINDILDLSKIESARTEVTAEPSDPHRVLVEVMSLLRVRAVEQGITLDCEWQSPVPETILTDSARLRQLLVNLVGNAVKFTEEGSVRVTAAIEEATSTKPTLRIEITDTGIGIAEDKIAEIFNPFVQADASVTRRFGGTGLGLAICRRLAEAMKGTLDVTSEPGVGSCFTLRLPTGSLRGIASRTQSVCDGLHSRDRAEPASQADSDLSGARLLVVEDGETNRRLIDIVLRRAGAEVEMAHNGKEGVEAAMACDFDAILMDMQMPVMDGYTAAAKLRAAGYEGPIIALTAHAMKGDADRCLEAGCSDYLTKPIDAPVLLAKLASLCGGETTSHPVTKVEETVAPNDPIASTLPTDDEEFRAVVEAFLDKSREAIEEMQQQAERKAWPELRDRAHWLKGSGGTAGYALLSNHAADLEATLANEPDPAAVRECLGQLKTLHSRLIVEAAPAAV